jgi:tetrahydromethanopterin S-methyltransferase subunit A
MKQQKPVPRITSHYDSRKEWQKDPQGYFLIKVFYERGRIGIRHCNYRHEPLLDIYGKDAESIVQTAVREGLVTTLQHAAYLGHELQKAETALKLRLEYVQDKPLDYKKKTTKKESGRCPAN